MTAAVLGWVGTIGTMTAYILQSNGRLVSTSRTYAAMNVCGGLLGGSSAMLYAAWPSFASNLVWAGVGVWGLITSSRGSTRTRPTLVSEGVARDLGLHGHPLQVPEAVEVGLRPAEVAA